MHPGGSGLKIQGSWDEIKKSRPACLEHPDQLGIFDIKKNMYVCIAKIYPINDKNITKIIFLAWSFRANGFNALWYLILNQP